MRKISLLLILLASSTVCLGDKYDIKISADNNPTYRTSHGYFTYTIKVTNISPAQSHQVELKMPEKGYGYRAYIQEMTKTVVVGPQTSIDVTMLQPAIPMMGNQLGVTVDGYEIDPVSFVHANHAQSYGLIDPSVLVSQSVKYDEILDKAKAGLTAPSTPKYGGRSGIVNEMFVRSDLPVEQWHKNWLNYSCLDSIILSSADMTIMGQDVREAIYDYVRAGGSLLVLGEYSDPTLRNWPTSPFIFEKATHYRMGFGTVLICQTVDASQWSQSFWEHAADICWNASRSPFISLDDYEMANTKFPIADISVPVRGLFTLVLIFAIVIGPVNLIMLSRWKKRFWLLWTVPAMSLVTCVIIFVYSIFAEGWTAYGRTLSVTVLDQRDHKATTLGRQAFYSPLSRGDGLHYDLNTEITMLGIQHFSSETRPCRIDLTTDQHLQAGFLKSRVPAHFMIRKSQMSRQRIIVETDDKGNLTAGNGLGAAIKKFYYVQKQGDKTVVYFAKDIGAGAKVKLTEPKEFNETSQAISSLRDFYQGYWPSNTEAFNAAGAFIENKGYVAYCDEPLFIEQGLKGAQQKQSQSVVIGIME